MTPIEEKMTKISRGGLNITNKTKARRIDCMVFLILEKGEGETKKNIEVISMKIWSLTEGNGM